jgi:hypothetical protein
VVRDQGVDPGHEVMGQGPVKEVPCWHRRVGVPVEEP